MGVKILNEENINIKVMEGDEFITGAVSVIQTDHKYIHYGKAFTCEIQALALAGSASKIIRFKTPAIKYVHLRPTSISTSANKIKVEFFEEPTITANGTAKTCYNRNRISSNLGTVIIGEDATVSADGNLLFRYGAGSTGSPQSRSGGSVSGDADEWVLKQDTEYILKITNYPSTATDVFIGLFWYEEDEGIII